MQHSSATKDRWSHLWMAKANRHKASPQSSLMPSIGTGCQWSTEAAAPRPKRHRVTHNAPSTPDSATLFSPTTQDKPPWDPIPLAAQGLHQFPGARPVWCEWRCVCSKWIQIGVWDPTAYRQCTLNPKKRGDLQGTPPMSARFIIPYVENPLMYGVAYVREEGKGSWVPAWIFLGANTPIELSDQWTHWLK